VSELGGSQISTLLEALPGIANVLRSPVADALVNTIRAAARLGEFQLVDAEELVKYGVCWAVKKGTGSSPMCTRLTGSGLTGRPIGLARTRPRRRPRRSSR
jgi:hypothetical protein